MALSAKNQVLASEFNALKASVKEEMNRRCRQDSLAGYAGTNYDFTVTPTAGGQILVEHINKIIEPINAIKSTGFASNQSAGAQIKALDAVKAQLDAHKVFPMQGSGTDCAGGCAGLCSSGCWDSCTGCTSSCTSSCTSCSGCSGCGGACSSSCSGCSGTCSGTCSGGCSGGCTSCSGTCSGGCGGGCKGSCSGSCSAVCTHGCTS